MTRLIAERAQLVTPQPPDSILAVLLVDDEDGLRTLLEEYLQGKGYEVRACAGCREALEVLEDPNAVFHVVLTDLKLPDGDGLEIIKRVKKKLPLALTAVMTGYASLETAVRAIRIGTYDYVTKPFTLDEFEILINNMSDKVRLTEKNRQAEQKLDHLYAKLDALQDEKIELLRLNRRVKADFEKVFEKLDDLSLRVRNFQAS